MKRFPRFPLELLLLVALVELLLLVAVAVPAGAQVVDSVRITIQGVPDQVRIAPVPMPITVGDSVQFTATMLDADGDTLNAVFSWASSAPSVFAIGATSGLGVALRKLSANDPPVFVKVYAEPFDTILVGGYVVPAGPSTLTIGDTVRANLGDQLQFCAYFLRGVEAIAQTEGSPGAPCPLVMPRASLEREVRALLELPPELRAPFPPHYWRPALGTW